MPPVRTLAPRSLPWALALVLGPTSGCRTPQPPTTPPVAPTGESAEADPAPRDLELHLDSHSACMREGGEVLCWGKRVTIPDGSAARPDPMMTIPVRDVDRFAVGSDRICAISKGSLSCWGHDMDETPPLNDEADPIIETVDLVEPVTDVRIDDTTVCALDGKGQLLCWTYEEPEEPEEYEEYDEDDEEPPWMELHELDTDIKAFDVGDTFACAILSGGSITCWGADPHHVDVADRDWDTCTDEVDWSECDEDEDEYDPECEDYDPEEECDDAYEDQLDEGWQDGAVVRSVPRATAIAAGNAFACVLTEEGHVYCWGDGGKGQLGNGSAGDSLAPVRVLDIDDAVAIDANANQACAVHRDGGVSCWGSNRYGAVGSRGLQQNTPWTVPGIDDAVDVVVHTSLSCAIVRRGPPRCWGNDTGNRIQGARPKANIAAVPIKKDVTRVLPYGRDTCAAHSDGSMECWGRLELSTTHSLVEFMEPRPSPHRDLTTMLSRGPCALTTAKELRCWRTTAQMHERGPTTRKVSDVVAVDTGSTTCAVSGDGQVHCFPGVTSPTTVASAITTALDVAVGDKHACAVRRDGQVACWLLDETISKPATLLPGLKDAAGIADISDQVCVRTSGGRVRCWQWNALDKPSYDHTLDRVDDLVAGSKHFCALARGTVWCWGNNGSGQLGPQTEDSSSAGPVKVLGLPKVEAIATGSEHTCARTAKGAVHCWGRSSEGQLGRLPTSYVVTPTPILPEEDW